MKKLVAVLLVLLLASTALFAADYHDVGVFFGLGQSKAPVDGISFSYGADFGLTDTLELSLWGISDIVPVPGKHTMLGVEIGKSLLGQRNTASAVSGININTILSVGGFYRLEEQGYGVMLGIAPVAIGSPAVSKREKFLKTNVGWDFANKELILAFSALDLELYLRGTYRDYL